MIEIKKIIESASLESIKKNLKGILKILNFALKDANYQIFIYSLHALSKIV